MLVETCASERADRQQAADGVRALAKIELRPCGCLACIPCDLKQPFPSGPGIVLGDRPDEAFDLRLDAPDLLVEESKLLARGIALAALGAELFLDVAVRGARREP